MKYVFSKTIFVDEDGVLIENNYNRENYKIKKQWYERKFKDGAITEGATTINQRYVILEENKERQLKLKLE